jgi:hypothetical protein
MRFAMEVQWRKLWTLMFRATEVILALCSLCVRFGFALCSLWVRFVFALGSLCVRFVFALCLSLLTISISNVNF